MPSNPGDLFDAEENWCFQHDMAVDMDMVISDLQKSKSDLQKCKSDLQLMTIRPTYVYIRPTNAYVSDLQLSVNPTYNR